MFLPVSIFVFMSVSLSVSAEADTDTDTAVTANTDTADTDMFVSAVFFSVSMSVSVYCSRFRVLYVSVPVSVSLQLPYLSTVSSIQEWMASPRTVSYNSSSSPEHGVAACSMSRPKESRVLRRTNIIVCIPTITVLTDGSPLTAGFKTNQYNIKLLCIISFFTIFIKLI